MDTLENGTGLFSDTKGVEEFSFSLPSLANGSNMFANCNLSEKAVESILRTIPEYSEGSHPLTIKMSGEAFKKFNEITGNYLMAPGTISYKGWDIASNSIITIPVAKLTTAIEEIVGEGKVIIETVPTENKVVVHTDRVDDTQLEAVTALLERELPMNIEVNHENYMPMPYVLNKLKPMLDEVHGGEDKYILEYDEAVASLKLSTAYPNLDVSYKDATEAVFLQEVPPSVQTEYGYGVTPYVVDYLLYDYEWEPYQFYNIFPHTLYTEPFALPDDMPFPEKLAAKTNVKNAVSTSMNGPMMMLRRYPRAWLFDNATSFYQTFSGMDLRDGLPENMTLSKMTYQRGMFARCKFSSLPDGITFSELTNLTQVCQDCVNLTHLSPNVDFSKADGETSWSAYTFTGCKLDKPSAIAVLRTLKQATDKWKLGIGIHVDHKYDVDVNLALKKVDINYEPTVELPEEVTEGKGWTLTVQWNGTPTKQASATYGLRKAPIYAKVSEMELPDGTTEQFLDWGHYVTDPTGYEEFASVEEAREYYGLPGENIEEEELTNV